MTRYEVGDVVSVEFPFSDLQRLKRRPGLVLISADPDLLVARATTHSPQGSSGVALTRWSEMGLTRPSTIRLTKLATIDLRLVHHKIGHLAAEDARAVAQAWQQLTGNILAELLK